METDTYLSKVRDLLNSCHVPGKELTAAWAGALVNLKVGSYKDLGFTNFRQVLEDLENQGFLTIVTTEKDALGIELIGHQPSFPGMVSGDSGMNSPTSNRKRVCHLAPKIWRAFVYVQPLGDRYLNKHTGEVLNADSAPSGEFWKKLSRLMLNETKIWQNSSLQKKVWILLSIQKTGLENLYHRCQLTDVN